MPEIKIDKTSLPEEGRKVTWRTWEDFYSEGRCIWYTGVFTGPDDYLFVNQSGPGFHSRWDVMCWEYMDDKIPEDE